MATRKSTGAKTPAKRASTKKPAPKKDPLEGLSVEQIQSAVRAGQELESAGLPVPAKVKQITEAWQSKFSSATREDLKRELAKMDELEINHQPNVVDAGQIVVHPVSQPPKRSNVQNYIRTIYNAPFHFRWTTDEGKKKEYRLEARGQRGDIHPIAVKDAEDSAFQHALTTNVNLGAVEIISAEEADYIVARQTTNQATVRQHNAVAALRGPQGKPYLDANGNQINPVRTEAEFNEQGVVVARLKPMEGTSEIGEVVVDRGGINRNPQVTPQRQLGGNPAILSDGFAESSQFIPAPADNVQAKIADDLARQKGVGGVGATGIQQVTVAPVQRT